MKIVKLESSNVKRLRAVEVEPSGNVVVVGGRNGQGKTSLLDSIAYVMGGERAICDEPVRKGQQKAKVVCTLDNLVVTRTITAGGGGTLTVSNRDGTAKYSSPQRMLDELVGKLTFDPLEFSRMKPAQQLETLRGLVGLDFSELDARRKKLYDDRTVCGRDVTGRQGQIEALPHYPEAPAKEVSMESLAAEVEKVNQFNAKQDAAEQKREAVRARIESVDEQIAAADAEIDRLTKHRQERAEFKGRLVAEEASLPAPMQRLDAAPIRQQIADSEMVNAKVRANATRAAMQQQFQAAHDEYDRLTKEIEAIDDQKAKMLQATTFPVAGLGLSENGVEFNGLPFSQASSAEQLRISVAMGLAMNPKLKVLLIRDGSLLDDDSLAMVAEMADAADGQVWIERVGEGDECSVVIEDGSVKAAVEA